MDIREESFVWLSASLGASAQSGWGQAGVAVLYAVTLSNTERVFIPCSEIYAMDPLIRRCVQGDKDAFEELIRKYSPLVRSTISQVLGRYSYPSRKEDVEDLHNGLFLLLMEDDFRRLRQFQGRSSFGSYCRIIVIRHVLDSVRSQKLRFSIHINGTPDALADRSALPDDRVGLSEREEFLRQVLKTFSPSEQLLLKLTFEKGLSPREIAGVMDISMTAYYNKKSRIMKRIKKRCERFECYPSYGMRGQLPND